MASATPTRIRFAPLPDPNSPAIRDGSDDDYDSPVTPELNPKRFSNLGFTGVKRQTTPPEPISSSSSSSMHSLTPTPSNESNGPTERKGWRRWFTRSESGRPQSQELSRWSSVSSALSTNTTDSLFRTTSTTSYRGGNVRSLKKHAPTKSRRSPSADGLAHFDSARPQQRMLNGRVYGGKKNQNLFNTVPDREPEFVEWGYGGMGSVRSQREVGGAMWNKVQATVQDEDDGGGMAWVKRRKAERETKKQQEAEEAKKRAEEEQKPAQEPTTMPGEHDTAAVTVPRRAEVEDEEDEEADDDADDADDEDDCPALRKTSLGAGVEVISRHHKQ